MPTPKGSWAGELIVPQTLNAIYGPSGCFKTWFIVYALGRTARALPVGTMATRAARSLILSQEMRPQQIKKRLLALYSDKESAELGDKVAFRFDGTLFDFFARPSQSQKLLEKVITNSNNPDIVLIDPLNNIHTGDENSNHDMSIVSKSILEVLISTNKAGLYVHHKGKSESDSMRGATVLRDMCADMAQITPLTPKNGIPRSRFKLTKNRDLSDPDSAKPFSFWLEASPHDKEMREFVFDSRYSEVTEATRAHAEALRTVVEELAGLDGEVLKEALVKRLETLSWGEKKFEQVMTAAVRLGRVGRRKKGREVSYYIPLPGQVADSNGDSDE